MHHHRTALHLRSCIAAVVVVAAAAISGPAAATCYQVFLGNEVVYRSTDPPVDLSRSISEAVEERFGSGASMSFAPDDGMCPALDVRPSLKSSVPAWSAPSPGFVAGESKRKTVVGTIEKDAPHDTPALDLLDHFNGPQYQSLPGVGTDVDDVDYFYLTSHRSAGSSYVHTGPRGGKYVITGSGKKQYLSSGGGRRRH